MQAGRGIVALLRRGRPRYIGGMKQLALPFSVKLALGLTAAAAATGAAFAAWMEQGAGIVLATVEAGLAWCF